MLSAISPIDGRYRKYTEPLAKFFSEFAFIQYRIVMESEYLIAIAKIPSIKIQISNKHQEQIRNLAEKFSNKDAEEIKKIEQTTNHDLKAIEYWMRKKLPKELGNWIHFGLTSEDATNIAYGLMVSGSLDDVMVPALEKILHELQASSFKFKATAMLARTHGQPASPTTFGKEMAVFASRLW